MKNVITIRQDFENRYKEKLNNYSINDDVNINENIRIYYINIIDNSTEVVCPYCDKATSLVHHYKKRFFLDGTIINNKDYIYYVKKFCSKTYECTNKKCKKFFTPSNPFVKGKEHYTNGFNNVIVFLYKKHRKISEIIKDFDNKGIFLNRNLVSKMIKNK